MCIGTGYLQEQEIVKHRVSTGYLQAPGIYRCGLFIGAGYLYVQSIYGCSVFIGAVY